MQHESLAAALDRRRGAREAMALALVQLRAIPRNWTIANDPIFAAEYKEWVAAGKPALTQQERWQKPWHFELEDLARTAVRELEVAVEAERAVVHELKEKKKELLRKIQEAKEIKSAADSLLSLR